MNLPVASPVMLWMAMKWSSAVYGPLPLTDAGIGYSLNGQFTWLYRLASYNPNTSQQLVCVAHFTPPANTPPNADWRQRQADQHEGHGADFSCNIKVLIRAEVIFGHGWGSVFCLAAP